MNFIYDIYLNLNNILYDFFDWNKSDKLIHIKKIPIFKINEEDFKNLIRYDIKLDMCYVNSIYKKTELWNIVEKIDYCALFCDNNNIVAIQFNKNGLSVKKSNLLLDEELEILETINRFKEKNITFSIIKKSNLLLETRKQLKEEDFIDKEFKNIDKNKLIYLYFECFGKHENNKKKILKSFKNLSKNSKSYKNLYDILKLTSTTNNKMI